MKYLTRVIERRKNDQGNWVTKRVFHVCTEGNSKKEARKQVEFGGTKFLMGKTFVCPSDGYEVGKSYPIDFKPVRVYNEEAKQRVQNSLKPKVREILPVVEGENHGQDELDDLD